MKSVYWVITQECTQACMHCYNNSGPRKPSISLKTADAIIRNLPSELEYINLSGGEILVVPDLFYYVLDKLHEKYEDRLSITIQTNTDLLDGDSLKRMIEHHVKRIDVTSIDNLHYFRRETLQQRKSKIQQLFDDFEMNAVSPDSYTVRVEGSDKPCYSFSGTTDPYYMGTVWPRGRAERNRIRTMAPVVNVCAGRSGAIGFLSGQELNEVSIQLDLVYPCWTMTKIPLGNAAEEPLKTIVERVRGNPVFEALSQGRPQDMGVAMGISTEEAEERILALGGVCKWCDEFFTKHFKPEKTLSSVG